MKARRAAEASWRERRSSSTTDSRNLWPEPRGGSPNPGNKDQLENYLHAQVCADRMQLAEAQRAIATNWVDAWTAAGRP